VLILRNPLTASFAAVLAAGALIAGCGGDDDDDGGSAGGAGGNSQTLRMALGAEPPSLDPGLATDITSFYVIQALMDPLVQLDDELEPAPAIAESWEVTDDGKTVTFALREDASWTNGDPVTAADFEYAWKRAIAPETAAGYAYQFFGISGAAEFNGCDSAKADCAALRDEVGVTALDDRTLEVKLTSSQPWFVAQAAHLSFLPVHRATVERFGEKWTEPKTIVTNGPFRLTKWNHDELLTLERWPDWRESDTVPLERIQMKIIPQATTAIQAFEAGEIDVCLEQPTCIPIGDFDRVKETPEFDEFPALLTTLSSGSNRRSRRRSGRSSSSSSARRRTTPSTSSTSAGSATTSTTSTSSSSGRAGPGTTRRTTAIPPTTGSSTRRARRPRTRRGTSSTRGRRRC
jgi:oligopeptide transport system substrate-binding protein